LPARAKATLLKIVPMVKFAIADGVDKEETIVEECVVASAVEFI
jgi:hypothetical protein